MAKNVVNLPNSSTQKNPGLTNYAKFAPFSAIFRNSYAEMWPKMKKKIAQKSWVDELYRIAYTSLFDSNRYLTHKS